MSKISKIIIFFFVITSALSGQIELSETLYNISVVGAIKNPGVYRLFPTSRISEAISMANYVAPVIVDGEIVQQEIELTRSSFRNIILKRQDEEIKLDLQKFFLLGCESENPYIQDGDLIIVPAIQKEVFIFGSVNKPGNYELINDDRILNIVDLALGLQESAFLEECLIIRYVENGSKFVEISINLMIALSDHSSEENLLLEHGDRIYIKSLPDYHPDKSVIVSGEVNYPEIYPIDGLTTNFSEILKKAEIKPEISDLENAIFVRKSISKEIDPEFERLKLISPTEMTFLEYEYFKAKIRDYQGKFSINLQLALDNPYSEKDVLLKDEDFIYIPQKELTVTISGKVTNPGLVNFRYGMNYLDYINCAGGYAWRAKKNKVRLIKGKTGIWLKPDKDTIVEPGDEIFVPEKPEYNYWTITKETIVVLSQIATLFLVIQNASTK